MTAATGWHPFDVVARVLAERLRGCEPSAQLGAALASPTVDWERVVGRADAHWVLAAFAAAVRDLGLAGALKPELRAFLDAVHAANAERNAQLRDQLAEVAGILNRIGVEPVLLKGAIRLVDGLYPDTGWRAMRDLDVLVPAGGLGDAVEALRGGGYIPDQGMIKNPIVASERQHLPGLRRPGRLAPVEVHRKLFLSPRRQRLLQAAEVLDGSRLVAFDGVAARVPSSEHQVMHLIGHCQITDHGYALGSIQLRDRLEAAALARWSAGGVDWEAVSARFAAAGYRRPLLAFLLSLGDGALCAVPAARDRIDPLTALQGRRVARRARSVTTVGVAPRVAWGMALLKSFITEGETRRFILSLPVKEVAWRLCHRGPRPR